MKVYKRKRKYYREEYVTNKKNETQIGEEYVVKKKMKIKFLLI